VLPSNQPTTTGLDLYLKKVRETCSKGFPFHPAAGWETIKKSVKLYSELYTIATMLLTPRRGNLPWPDPVGEGGRNKKEDCIANALITSGYHYILPPPPPPAYVASVTVKLQMEAKFNPTLRPVSLPCVSRGFPRNFQRSWKGKTIVTENAEQCAIFCTKSLNVPTTPGSSFRDMLTSKWPLTFYVLTHTAK
jgi:hypothetical protein